MSNNQSLLNKCCICSNQIKQSFFEPEYITNCKSHFHYKCICTWLENNTCCPVCKNDLCINTTVEISSEKSMCISNMFVINGSTIIAKNLLELYNKANKTDYNHVIRGNKCYSNNDIIKCKFNNKFIASNSTFIKYQPSDIISDLDNDEYIAYRNERFGNKIENSDCKLILPEISMLSNCYEGKILFELNEGWLIKVNKPFCFGYLTHSGNTHNMRHYFISKDKKIYTIGAAYDIAQLDLTEEAIKKMIVNINNESHDIYSYGLTQYRHIIVEKENTNFIVKFDN